MLISLVRRAYLHRPHPERGSQRMTHALDPMQRRAIAGSLASSSGGVYALAILIAL